VDELTDIINQPLSQKSGLSSNQEANKQVHLYSSTLDNNLIKTEKY